MALFLVSSYPVLAKDEIMLQAGKFSIILSDKEPSALKLAVETLRRDFLNVTGTKPSLQSKLSAKDESPVLVVVNRETNGLKLALEGMPPLEGFESHRVWADPATNRIYLDGADMRGSIYAVYTFSERFLGVPPLWRWASWVPKKTAAIAVPRDCNLFFKSPQVRYRAWFPNDTDMFTPWRKISWENDELWLETMLRLKLNTVEIGNSIAFPGLLPQAELFDKYGMVLTSHHFIALNSSFGSWKRYWKQIRGMVEAPALLLSNEKQIIEFWEYCARTAAESGIENLWNIAFRGDGDKPFWATFADAPQGEAERATVINRMLQTQMDIINKYSKEKNPYVRITFYDEMADLLAAGLVRPPVNENMIWVFCSGRRDHYPYTDIQQFNPTTPVKLGYYMNFQFTSTGSHLAPAEGPWKMEFNYRYVNSKSPLYFSVVNAGNLREHIYEMSANAKLLWDFAAYTSDSWNRDYAAQYFGGEYATQIAALYKDFFNSYWQQRKSDFPGGMPRQFIFQDQRYALAFAYIARKFYEYNPNPLPLHYGYERVPGRVFRVVAADNGADNEVDAIFSGMAAATKGFSRVTAQAKDIYDKVPENKRQFFYDNLIAYSSFMEHLSRSLYHFAYAYKNQADKAGLVENLEASLQEMESARAALFASQHGIFSTWYETEKCFNMSKVLKHIDDQLQKAKQL